MHKFHEVDGWIFANERAVHMLRFCTMAYMRVLSQLHACMGCGARGCDMNVGLQQ